MIAFAATQPSDDEIAAIVAALAALEPAPHTAEPAPSPWKMAGREYAQWGERCLARF